MDVHTSEQRRRNMQAIRSTETKMEVLLGRTMWAQGLRYRKNDKSVFGKPDFTFKKLRVAVFVDSEFFHGKDWSTSKYRIKSNQEFWWRKIEGNQKRDLVVNKKLKADGWIVIRVWSMDVKKRLEFYVSKIEKTIQKRKNAY